MSQQSGDRTAWLPFLHYFGALTFDMAKPSTHLKAPNRIAARRFGGTIMAERALRSKMSVALATLANQGLIADVIGGYVCLMQIRDAM